MPKCFQTTAKVLFIHLCFSTLLQNFSLFLSLDLSVSVALSLPLFLLVSFLSQSFPLALSLFYPLYPISLSLCLYFSLSSTLFLLCGSKIVHKFAVYTSTTVNLLGRISREVCRLPSLQWCQSSYKAILRPSSSGSTDFLYYML